MVIMREIVKGSTDQSVVIRIVDAADGTPETAVEHNTSGIDLWYRREGATKTSITEAALASLDAAHSDGGIEHIGDGYYRLDLPDAAVASGANGVTVGGTVTDMVVIGCYVPLVSMDPYDAVRAGLTALPNAAADAAGGLPISDAGGLDLDARLDAAVSTRATPAQVNAEVVDALATDVIADSVPADGSRPTIAQALYMLTQFMTERGVTGTTMTVKKPDGSTTLMTFTLDDATAPTSITRAS